MKNIFIILIVLGAFSMKSFSQSQRLVLFEEFTNASCGPCATQNPGFDALLSANTSKCTSVKYHTSWPGTDPMYSQNPTESSARVSYYGVNSVPYAFMDGSAVTGSSYVGAPSNVTQTMINNEYAVPASFELYINQQLSPGNDTIYVTMQGKATEAVSGTLVVHCVVIEKHIHFNSAPGGNGEKDFYNVMKKMLPDASGTSLPSTFAAGDYFILQFAWKLANVYDLDELRVVGFIQNVQTKAVQQAANTSATPITGLYPNDLELSQLEDVLPAYCETTLSPRFRLQNNGSNPLTMAEIKYQVNNENEAVYTWTGNLGFLENVEITLPAIAYTLNNTNTLRVYGISTNGLTDDYPKNDTLYTVFDKAVMAGTQVKVLIKTDNNPDETTWEIKDIQGNLLASGGPYTQALHTYTTNVDLGFGTCYEFTISDAGGDGLCCNNGNGFYKLSAGNTTIRTGTSFTGEQTSQFYSQSGVGIKQHPDAASISVFPNPVESYATISFENAVNETVTVRLFNMQGSKVQEIPAKAYPSGSHEISIDCTAMPSGIYSIQMTIGNKVFSEKISVR